MLFLVRDQWWGLRLRFRSRGNRNSLRHVIFILGSARKDMSAGMYEGALQ